MLIRTGLVIITLFVFTAEASAQQKYRLFPNRGRLIKQLLGQNQQENNDKKQPTPAGSSSSNRSNSKTPTPATGNKKNSQLGAEVRASQRQKGLEIVRIDRGQAAQKAGLRVGDRIVSIGGINVENMDDLKQFEQIIEPGIELEFEIVRNGRKDKKNVRFGSEQELRAMSQNERRGAESVLDTRWNDSTQKRPQANRSDRTSSASRSTSSSQRNAAYRAQTDTINRLQSTVRQQQQTINSLRRQLQSMQQQASSRRSTDSIDGPSLDGTRN